MHRSLPGYLDRPRGLLLGWLLIGLLLAAVPSAGQPSSLPLYFFSAANCPHCAEIRPLLVDFVAGQPAVTLVEYDIWTDRQAFQQLLDLLATHGDLPVATPTLFLGDRYWIGFTPDDLPELVAVVQRCQAEGCADAMQRLGRSEDAATGPGAAGSDAAEQVMLPGLGLVDAREVSLPVVTLVLGLLDSVNPCAFFVLLFLLSLMVHVHSRLRMLVVGGVFVGFSGLIYFLFMAAWLNLFLLTGGASVITLLAGLVAILFGLLNIKDYFLFHRGVSLSIPEQVKPRLYQRVRNLVQADSYPALLGGTVLLAIAANSYELLCTAGFPMVFTRILTLKGLTPWQYYSYLLAYNLVYILPLLLIVMAFAVTLGSHKLTENEGRVLKLVSGLMMAELGVVLVWNPGLLNNLAGTVGLLLAALLVSAVVVVCSKQWRAGKQD